MYIEESKKKKKIDKYKCYLHDAICFMIKFKGIKRITSFLPGLQQNLNVLSKIV